MTHKAEIVERQLPSDDDGIYPIADYIYTEDGSQEPDIDAIDDLANSWVFLD